VYGIKEKDMFLLQSLSRNSLSPKYPTYSNIYVQNITSTSVTVKNLADVRIIPDNKNKLKK